MHMQPARGFRLFISIILVFQLAISSLAQQAITPEITGLSQEFARLEGGTEILITGRNFTPESQVFVGDTILTDAVILSATNIRLRVPQQDLPGRVTLSVRTRAGIAQREVSVISKPLQDLADGQITTIAGGAPFLGDGRDARNAFLDTPLDVVADSAGNIFISDTVN